MEDDLHGSSLSSSLVLSEGSQDQDDLDTRGKQVCCGLMCVGGDHEGNRFQGPGMVNELWVEVDEVLRRPMPPDQNTRTVTIRLETLTHWQLTTAWIMLILCTVVPITIIRIPEGDEAWDDDLTRTITDCTASGSSRRWCQREAGARFWISIALILLVAAWIGVVYQHWRREPLWLPHSVVVLFCVGQILLEDPYSAFMVRFKKQYHYFTLQGELRGLQPLGCSLMTLAVLLLVDKCYRIDRPMHSGRILIMSLGSCWSLIYFHSLQNPNWLGDRQVGDLVAIGFSALVGVVSLVQAVLAYKRLRQESYMKYRYLNLLLRLLLFPCVMDVVIVTLLAESFVTLYITTLLLPLFLGLGHLPPGPVRLFPIVRRRAALLAAAQQWNKAPLTHEAMARSRMSSSFCYQGAALEVSKYTGPPVNREAPAHNTDYALMEGGVPPLLIPPTLAHSKSLPLGNMLLEDPPDVKRPSYMLDDASGWSDGELDMEPNPRDTTTLSHQSRQLQQQQQQQQQQQKLKTFNTPISISVSPGPGDRR